MTDRSDPAFPTESKNITPSEIIKLCDMLGWSIQKIKHTLGRNTGITKREYFAAAALTGIMANPERWRDIADRYRKGEMTYEEASKSNAIKAYSIADAMIERGQL